MKALALTILSAYKRWISPSVAPSCRYVPTCSEYAMEAIERYGVLQGGMKAVWRLMRCHPFVKGGLDPVVRVNRGHHHHDTTLAHAVMTGAAQAANSEGRTASDFIG